MTELALITGCCGRAGLQPNTVDLMKFAIYCSHQIERRTADGSNDCRTSQRYTLDRLPQSGRFDHPLALVAGERGAGGAGKGQPAATRIAGARGGLLCHRAGAVHAGFLPRGAALFAGRPDLAAGAGADREGHRQVGDLASAHPAGLEGAAPTVRRGGEAVGGGGDARGLVPELAPGESGRQHAGGGR